MGWMRFFLLGSAGNRLDIEELQEQVDRMRAERDIESYGVPKNKELAEELLQLQVRLGVLVRLLIEKGVITAEEYARLIAVGQSKEERR
jgi:DNA-binding MurR/RpiR family transcriptional regulator